MIVVSGMIGLGKTSVSTLLGSHLGYGVLYESVEDNPVLEKFYQSSEEDIQKNRYPFLLQLYFLQTRFSSIKGALGNREVILDRSIYEDWYFAKVNKELGKINELEFRLYEGLLNEMMLDIEGMPKKAPDLNIYLKASFDTVLKRIEKRGRAFEQDDRLIEYYRTLWQGYDEWLAEYYKASDVLVVDMDKTDIIENEEDANWLVEEVKRKLGYVDYCSRIV